MRPDAFVYAGKRLPRDERHGFLITLANPFNTNRTAIVQCGIPWATRQAHNHRFDRIPDVICYTDEQDRFGYPIAVEAGFIGDDGHTRWSPNPTAEAVADTEFQSATSGSVEEDSEEEGEAIFDR